jgi:putative hydrolase of the HAD superfamily
MTVEAVVFDWGGTLTAWQDVDYLESWRRVALTADSDRADELAAQLLAADEAVWQRTRSEFQSVRFGDVLVECGLVESAALLAAHCEVWEPYTFVDPEAGEVLSALRSRQIKVGLLSNTLWPRSLHEQWFERDGILGLFDAAVYSSEIPWVKPHPEAFRTALRAVGVADPARAVFVGDRPYDDIHGAKAVGMRAVLVPHSRIPESQKGPVEGVADAVITRLSELIPVVDAWRNGDARPGSRP